MQQLQMPQAIFDRMLAQAKQAVPLEACGILAGRAMRLFRSIKSTTISRLRFVVNNRGLLKWVP
ncbi:MAG: hypothetical protein KAR47_13205 [Planctomycetes bacterium]|nr:hypothetical protein [Planctomycetota bacterium]